MSVHCLYKYTKERTATKSRKHKTRLIGFATSGWVHESYSDAKAVTRSANRNSLFISKQLIIENSHDYATGHPHRHCCFFYNTCRKSSQHLLHEFCSVEKAITTHAACTQLRFKNGQDDVITHPSLHCCFVSSMRPAVRGVPATTGGTPRIRSTCRASIWRKRARSRAGSRRPHSV
ncbi:uncharacterized protein LOC135390507 [Ornithodoros turicata]|uniref:uncharacterized protein LOC135390507 n=1 Tax=Ornithodoros turicata TaxID=34597 RepID=UPI003138C1B6